MRKPTIRKYGPRGILMEWEPQISTEIHDQVVATTEYLEENHSDSILEIVPSYASLVVFLRENINLEKYIDLFRDEDIRVGQKKVQTRIWEVPVCYNISFGYDLESISKSTGLTPETIITLHSETTYRIYGVGFLPGFLYLGGLNEKIHVSRKNAIKQLIPKGSVGIGGEQTGIYPLKSPGGWNIIGRTPIDLFNPELNPPSPFAVGDSIQFSPIGIEEFNRVQSLVKEGSYTLKLISND